VTLDEIKAMRLRLAELCGKYGIAELSVSRSPLPHSQIPHPPAGPAPRRPVAELAGRRTRGEIADPPVAGNGLTSNEGRCLKLPRTAYRKIHVFRTCVRMK